MAYEFKFPFEPPWEDLKMTVVASNGTKCYIFDSCVVRDPVERAKIDERIGDILARAERRQLMERMAAEEESEL